MLKRMSLLISLFTLLTFPAFADARNLQKIYCSPEKIELSNSMILIHLDGNIIAVDTLLVDQGGIYFCENAMRCVYCKRPLNPNNICECPVIH